MSTRLKVSPAFSFQRSINRPDASKRVFAFAGIAKPQQFFDELDQAGWQVVNRRSFRDHHQYSEREIADIAVVARAAGAEALITTSKDAVRLSTSHQAALAGIPMVEVALHISIEPAFQGWVRDRLSRARTA
jgi:tetraacyldisaccharide 4'-kinase